MQNNLKHKNIIIAYGTESGNSKILAETTAKTVEEQTSQKVFPIELNDLHLQGLSETDFLIVIAATFGDGEPCRNAADLWEELEELNEPLKPFNYSIFGLGDVGFDQFCKFGKDLHEKFEQLGAVSVINPVYADTDFDEFYELWNKTLIDVFNGNLQAGLDLNLQVQAYGEKKPHVATILDKQKLNQGGNYNIYSFDLCLNESGMAYRAGDLVYILAKNSAEYVEYFLSHFSPKSVAAIDKELLKSIEFRQLSKTVVRNLLKIKTNAELKDLIKISNKDKFNQYIYGRDLLDLLQDFYPEYFSEDSDFNLAELLAQLPNLQPRAYSIASSSLLDKTKVRICVREVAYKLADRSHYGTVSHSLASINIGDKINMFIRPNFEFNLNYDETKPLVFVATGAGIAPFIGFLEQLSTQKVKPKCYLFFGDRYRANDFLYEKKLQQFKQDGVLTEIFTAFSRDGAKKYYIQDELALQSKLVFESLDQGGYFYICGNKNNLCKVIDLTLFEAIKQHANLDDDATKQYLFELETRKAIKRDLF